MLGENLKRLRTTREITQKQVSDLLKISQNAYTQYENNKREPEYATLCVLADFFNVSTDELLGRNSSTDDGKSVLTYRLKAARLSSGLTQQQACEKLNIEIGTLSGYEVGRRRPNAEMLVKISALYGVSVDYLLGVEFRKFPITKHEVIDRFRSLPFGEQKAWLSELILLISPQ